MELLYNETPTNFDYGAEVKTMWMSDVCVSYWRTLLHLDRGIEGMTTEDLDEQITNTRNVSSR